MGKTSIEWTDASWNPIRGCSRVSEGCRNCYAERVAARFSGPGQAYEGLARMTDAGPRWTGEVRLIKEHLEDPLRWKRPRRIFVNSMSDLFHEKVSLETMTDIFEVMAKCPQHIFQVLTKRPDLMMRYMHSHIGVGVAYRLGKQKEPGFWPLPNVWIGVSVEDQKTAEERIPLLLRTEAAVRWLSAEPLLGSINLEPWFTEPMPKAFSILSRYYGPEGFDPSGQQTEKTRVVKPQLDWVVAGGESGPGARPMHPDWARSLRDQCVAAGVAFFFKQWGAWLPVTKENQDDCKPPSEWVYLLEDGEVLEDIGGRSMEIQKRKFGSVSEENFRRADELIRKSHLMSCVGKKSAGRLLDGRTWDEMPEVPA